MNTDYIEHVRLAKKTPVKTGYMSIYDRILCNNTVPIDGPVIVMDSTDYYKYIVGKD